MNSLPHPSVHLCMPKKKAEENVEILILRNSKRWVVEAVLERTPQTKAQCFV